MPTLIAGRQSTIFEEEVQSETPAGDGAMDAVQPLRLDVGGQEGSDGGAGGGRRRRGGERDVPAVRDVGRRTAVRE